MNPKLVEMLAYFFKLKTTSVLGYGYSMPEIKEAARRRGLALRIIEPKEFSLSAIHEAQRKTIQANRAHSTSAGFWSGLRQALRIPDSVQVLVFQDIDQLDEAHGAALESVVKGDMDRPEQGNGFQYVWATSATRAPFSPRLEQAFHRHFWTAPKWLSELESKAADGLSEKLKSWPSGDFACPWLRWHFYEKRERVPRFVFVLQDWGLADRDESLEQAIGLVGGRNGDRTIKAIARNERLAPGITDGTICVMNAVWGLRNPTESKSGPLGDRIHRASFPMWASTLLKLGPERVFFCGGWAKEKEVAWNSSLNGAQAMETWIDWAEPERRFQLHSRDFGGMEFYFLRHPSAPGSDFGRIAPQLIL